jgi:hypothetical protein
MHKTSGCLGIVFGHKSLRIKSDDIRGAIVNRPGVRDGHSIFP